MYFRLGNIVPGVFTPVLSKHTKYLSLVDSGLLLSTITSGILSEANVSLALAQMRC